MQLRPIVDEAGRVKLRQTTVQLGRGQDLRCGTLLLNTFKKHALTGGESQAQ